MLSYQHIYHAGNAADLHKHALLAWMLDYLTGKDKPLSYIETHAGRGLYDLSAAEARKTAEADAGIARAEAGNWLSADHPLMQPLMAVRTRYGDSAYAGSPLIAQHFLRDGDSAHLAELHPAEYDALNNVAGTAKLYRQDGFAMAQAVSPPTPRRGLMLVDPSYEVKADYAAIPGFLQSISRKWNVGILALWYPLLRDDQRQAGMIRELQSSFPDALTSEIRFPPAKPGHGMIGSGMFVVNPPWGLDAEATRIEALFRD
ncbi:23S rRNA (adenine(2030)-N(6))-methyltransferase RlmJ [Paracoccus aerodenitrificans]|uniref:23S rRNA (adenine(2030)-N(6))-methyltransferase RlmJ n=1 Tax=Paracoccus aerodenitrificans TaxID=3017781 RepID=UPI0022EFDDCD|nr:23S rRNA (adenine(2030)-N(6))-methyltransferase RlmJ [Paracoccus aerodenitrificans]WBU63151.1 23S rRNA (adenine(2030)-N(6))-methyltransferase RlmJ [Paracoccus aerodenitrificans]